MGRDGMPPPQEHTGHTGFSSLLPCGLEHNREETTSPSIIRLSTERSHELDQDLSASEWQGWA